MFIRVKYGDNETLICNPGCTIVNLLANIKNRTGHSGNTITIDLTDDSGLIQELDGRRLECAADYLSTPGTYVLVKKQRMLRHQDNIGVDASPVSDRVTVDELEMDDNVSQLNSDRVDEYVPLLNNWHQLLPGFRIRRANDATDQSGLAAAARRRVMRRDRNKSPSPAGVKPTASKVTASAAAARTAGKMTGQQTPINRKTDKRTSIATV